ncbi:glycosyltransferase [Infirmifilum lucidum]|uniref:Glycosyltransferase n=1 Tax=Infirmifilum lucidum TaxID=2776706 RepID=A0A7L9FHQ7_9CREN|nr:glycosyltransferase family 2 protein [Infirmifilum lucidum]QOJ79299.1 glycosyltransferase [Infirmifilum lucidum]
MSSGSPSKSDVTAVIPTLQEEEGIGLVIDELKANGVEKIIVVDGGSTDRTREVASSKGARVVLQEGRGKALAIKTALKYVETPWMLVIDGDYTYDASYVDAMLSVAKDYDEIIGARLLGRENIPLLNRFGNWVITKAFNVLFGVRLSDVCSGMYLVRTEIAREVWFEGKGFSVEVEIAAHVANTTRRIAEVPIRYRRRVGKGKLGKRHGFLILFDTVRLAWRYNPTLVIFLLGSLSLMPGVPIFLWVFYEYVFRGVEHFVWAIISLQMVSVGLVSVLLSILSLYLKRLEYRLIEKIEKRLRQVQA